MSNPTNKTVSQKMNDLSELVAWFEGDEFELETAIEKYKQAEELASEIDTDLKALKNEITVLKTKFDS